MAEAEAIEGEYDYIIVGAGSAGCLLANRLSADPTSRVLVLEAGGRDNWIWFHIPVGYLFAIGNPRSRLVLQDRAGAKASTAAASNYPRGKVIGGSSAINAMVYMRGQAADYDHWRQLGLAGWGWDDVLPYFKQHENHFLGETELHGGGGEMRVEEPRVRWDLLDAFRDAAAQAGIKSVPDFNTGDNEGCCAFHVNQKRGRRWSAATRVPQARASSRQSAARDRMPGRRRHLRRPSRRRRALAARRRDTQRALPRRGHLCRRLDRIDADHAVVRRRAGVSICATTALPSSPTGRASAPICRIICSCA